MNGKFKALATVAVATALMGTAAYAGPPRHHHGGGHHHHGYYRNDGLGLAAGIVDLVRTVIAPPVVVAPAPVRCVETVPVVVAPAPVVYRPTVWAPPPPPPRYHRGPHHRPHHGPGGHRR